MPPAPLRARLCFLRVVTDHWPHRARRLHQRKLCVAVRVPVHYNRVYLPHSRECELLIAFMILAPRQITAAFRFEYNSHAHIFKPKFSHRFELLVRDCGLPEAPIIFGTARPSIIGGPSTQSLAEWFTRTRDSLRTVYLPTPHHPAGRRRR